VKILLSSHSFHPEVGGIEEVSLILAREFSALGHTVRVITQTAARQPMELPFEVHRRPSATALFRLVRWCDVVFHNNISLRTAWPLFLIPRPWVIAHHTWIAQPDGRISWGDRLKQVITRAAHNIAVSRAIEEHLHAPAEIIGNPYRDDLFTPDPSTPRDRDLVFLGRLVSDKGANLLLDALPLLAARGLRPTLTVIGSGPEESTLRRQASQLGGESQVDFAGQKTGPALVALLRRHRFIVIPSAWREPFGLIALEGLACGCIPIGADGGGLAEAIGPCGALFARGDVPALAEKIAELLTTPTQSDAYRAGAPAHLADHHARRVAEAYLRVLESAVRSE
jgi:glycosyltransferase involved in cell wall biosynthesis